MKVLITGGAGFIGRWVVKRFLDEGHEVKIIDNLSNGRYDNIAEFAEHRGFMGFTKGDISVKSDLEPLFDFKPDICVHLAAQINVQESLEEPHKAFLNNVVGTYNVVELAVKHDTKVVIIGTCMVYDMALERPLDENSPPKPASPYAGSKLAAEDLAISYYHGLGLPVTVLRPFNTYGPFQKSNMEGGVVSIFVRNKLDGKTLNVFGDGTQTRDLLYVEDCAEFIYMASVSENAVGEIINAGTGVDIPINDLAMMIVKDEARIQHVEHHHPQSEIPVLVCDFSKARRLLGWEPRTSLEDGIKKLEEWMREGM